MTMMVYFLSTSRRQIQCSNMYFRHGDLAELHVKDIPNLFVAILWQSRIYKNRKSVYQRIMAIKKIRV
ncbi:hypothetical protein V1478_006994 [Vespula squamosa]|uniref:Uncharacterized protein n=1 Tax=Vespula squamosa TaxID=30214 RepID=A0ABD2B1X2_VESSQ